MTLTLEIAAGYVLGQIVCWVGGLLLKMASRSLISRSVYWRRAVRRSLARDRALNATLVGPWVTRER